MRRPRHRPLRSGRLLVALLSAIALVAYVCLPALAQAECTDSSCAQYETDIPTVGKGDQKANKAHGGNESGRAEASEAPPANQGKTPPSDGGSAEEGEERKGTAAPGKDKGGNGPADKGGSPAGGGTDKAATGVEGEKSPGATAQGQNASHSDGGGSSPLVPILIAIAVLAAISIGAVIYRQRRQGGTGSPVSPNA